MRQDKLLATRMPDFIIHDRPAYVIAAYGGKFVHLVSRGTYCTSFFEFISRLRYCGTPSRDGFYETMQKKGIRFPNIKSQCLHDLKHVAAITNCTKLDLHATISKIGTEQETLHNERRYGLSKGMFYELKKISDRRYPLCNSREPMRTELIRTVTTCNTRNDLESALGFAAMSDDSPLLRHVLKREAEKK